MLECLIGGGGSVIVLFEDFIRWKVRRRSGIRVYPQERLTICYANGLLLYELTRTRTNGPSCRLSEISGLVRLVVLK